MEYVAQIALNGLVLASIYCLIAVGLTLVFGVMHIMNFAQGELLMIGAYVTLWAFADQHMPFLVAVLLAAVATGALGVLIERTVFRRLRATPLMGFVASLGVAAILQVMIRQSFGTHFQAVPMAFNQTIEILGGVIILQRAFIVVAALVLLALLGIFLHRTRTGLAIIATAEDADAAALQGMSPNSTARITMFLSAAMAGIAGALLAPVTIIDPFMGQSYILIAFVIVIVGGAGSIRGALVAAIVFGFLQSTVTTVVSPTAATAVGLVTMLIVLTFRPSGIFGHE